MLPLLRYAAALCYALFLALPLMPAHYAVAPLRCLMPRAHDIFFLRAALPAERMLTLDIATIRFHCRVTR